MNKFWLNTWLKISCLYGLISAKVSFFFLALLTQHTSKNLTKYDMEVWNLDDCARSYRLNSKNLFLKRATICTAICINLEI